MENRRQQTSVTMRPSPACPPLVAVIHSSQRRRRLKLLVSLLRLNLSKTSAASAEPAPWTKTGTYQSANPTPIWSMDRSMDIYGTKGYWTTSSSKSFSAWGVWSRPRFACQIKGMWTLRHHQDFWVMFFWWGYLYILYMGMGQNPVPLVNPKIAGKWMFIPLKMVSIGIDPYPYVVLWPISDPSL